VKAIVNFISKGFEFAGVIANDADIQELIYTGAGGEDCDVEN